MGQVGIEACPTRAPAGFGPARRVLPLVAAFVAFVAVCVLACPAKAYADFSVYVGYAGGPYYQKAYFTDSELWDMADSAVYEYFSADSGGYLRKGYGQGVQLAVLLAKSGIDPEHMFRFYMNTDDSYIEDDGASGANAVPWYYRELCGTTRYYYPAMRDNVTFEYNNVQFGSLDAIARSAQAVPSIIALRSSFSRITSLDDDVWETANLGTGAGYRLMYGQTAPNGTNARNFAELVCSITCIIGGEDGKDLPTVVIPDAVREALTDAPVGTTVKFTPGLDNVQDALVAQLGWMDIEWDYAQDKGVFTLQKNADGSVVITIVGESDTPVDLTATFGNSTDGSYRTSASMAIRGMAGAGARNVAELGGAASNTVSPEQVMAWAPEVVLLSGASSFYEGIMEDPTWASVPAVASGRVYEVPVEPYEWMDRPPSVQTVLGVKRLGNLIAPQVYDFDMVSEVREFYRLLWGYEMGEEEARSMLERSTLKAQAQ